MKTLLIAVTVFIPFSVGMQIQPPEPKEVVVTLTSGGNIEGEILAVRDSSILITPDVGTSDQALAQHRGRIIVVPHSGITTVEAPGTSHIGAGVLMGGIMGCTGGLIVGAATAKSSGGGLVNAPGLDQAIAGAIGGVVGGLGGMAIGAVIGGTMKENGQTYVTPDRRDFVLLRGVARYKTEPEFLKAITSK